MDGRLSRRLYVDGNGRKIYWDSFLSQGKAPLKKCDTSIASKTKHNGVAGPGSNGIPSMQIEDNAPIVSSGDDNPINTTSSGNNDVTLNHENTSLCFWE